MRKFVTMLAMVLTLTMLFNITAFAYTYEKIEITDIMEDDLVESLTREYEESVSEDTASSSMQPSTWAVDTVNKAIELNLVPDDLQKEYTQTITRAEYCALAVTLYEKYIGNEITGRKTFVDTNDINVQKMGALGVVTGVGNDKFAPDDPLTREQAAVVLANLSTVLGKPLTEKETTFSDKNTISSWALVSVEQVQEAKIMNGVGDNMFNAKGSYTKEQSIITMVNIFEMIK